MKQSQTANKALIKVIVEKTLPFGVFVRMPDGNKGYIRRREMSWSGDTDPRDIVHVGDTINAVLLTEVNGRLSTELSHRQSLPDPWYSFVEKYEVGDIVRGDVKDIRPFGIFVQIMAGVNGLIPLNELSSSSIEKPEEIFWVGDRVEAVITRINQKTRRIHLSIRKRLILLDTASNFVAQLSSPDDNELFVEERPIENVPEAQLMQRITPAQQTQLGQILVVEDQDDLRLPFIHWLAERGYAVLGAASIAEAQKLIDSEPISICFMDIELPDGDGLIFAAELKNSANAPAIIVMSISEWLSERIDEMAPLDITAVLLKPLDLGEIDALLGRFLRGERPRFNPQTVSLKRGLDMATAQASQPLPQAMRQRKSLSTRFRDGLTALLMRTGAQNGFVFHMEPVSGQVTIVARVGDATLQREALYALDESPVKDVIYEREPILEGSVTAHAYGRFRKLSDLLSFESCIAIPIEDEVALDYAIFLFHEDQEAFTHADLQNLQATTPLFAAAIESNSIAERIHAASGILLSGQLAAGFGHEINNKISALEIQIRNLMSENEQLLKPTLPSGHEDSFLELTQMHAQILDTILNMKEVASLFQDLTRIESQEQIDINRVLREAVQQLRPLINKAKVRVSCNLDESLPHIPGKAIRLQQAFLNIILNAIQHMDLEGHPVRNRTLQITTTADNKSIKIYFEDSGPGIHKQLWRKIFSLGYSKRPGGTGLGLYISRSLIEYAGGSIIVVESHIQIGSKFLVELPVRGGQPDG